MTPPQREREDCARDDEIPSLKQVFFTSDGWTPPEAVKPSQASKSSPSAKLLVFLFFVTENSAKQPGTDANPLLHHVRALAESLLGHS